MSCGTQHKQIACPKCGSKMKRVQLCENYLNVKNTGEQFASRNLILSCQTRHLIDKQSFIFIIGDTEFDKVLSGL